MMELVFDLLLDPKLGNGAPLGFSLNGTIIISISIIMRAAPSIVKGLALEPMEV